MGLLRTSVVTGPSAEPLKLGDIKDHLRIERGETEEDDYLKTLRTAARQRAEAITNRKLITQTWAFYMNDWPGGDYITLPYAPLSTGTAPVVTYYDSDRSSNTLSSTAYYSDAVTEPPRLHLTYSDDWPTTTLDGMNPVKVQCVYGYGTASSDVPAAIRQAMLVMIADSYEARESFVTGTIVGSYNGKSAMVVDAILAPHRMYSF